MKITDPAHRWVEVMGGLLQSEQDPKNCRALVRAMLMLLEVRSMPNFVLFPAKFFAKFVEVYDIGPHTRFGLAATASGFVGLNDADASAIEGWLREVLAGLAPKDSLRAHLAKTFATDCFDTNHVGYGENNPLLVARLLGIAHASIAALEDFTVPVTRIVDKKEIREAINDFYDSRGYETSPHDDYVAAQKDNQSLIAGFTTGKDYLLVTVTE